MLEDAFVYGKSFATAATDFIPVAWSSPSAVIANLAQVILRYTARFEFSLLVPYTAKAFISLTASFIPRGSRLAVELVICKAVRNWVRIAFMHLQAYFDLFLRVLSRLVSLMVRSPSTFKLISSRLV